MQNVYAIIGFLMIFCFRVRSI